MGPRWWFYGLPVVVLALLAQSVLWVPRAGLESDGSIGPGDSRLRKFAMASIGDAKILNPALNADTASSQITALVFESLLEYDEELQLTGQLAREFALSESATVLINKPTRFDDGTPFSVQSLLTRIRSFVDSEPTLRSVVSGISVSEPRVESIEFKPAQAAPEVVAVQVRVPGALQFELHRVEPNLLTLLAPILGADYETVFDRSGMFVESARELSGGERELLDTRLANRFPVIEHNPQVLFRLRQGVRFHDGHELDAHDVRFTYEAIMNPKNLSPRVSDFEPIKSIEVLDRHTLRVTYKRLFSPALAAWTMGILPEHLLNPDSMSREMERRNLSGEARERFGLRDSVFNRAPIGTGPFRFVQWRSDELIHLSRYDDHWENRAGFEDYYYRVMPDKLAQELEFRTSAIDLYSPEPHQVQRFLDDPGFQHLQQARFVYTYIAYNMRREPFSDPRVRRALGLAIDMDQVIEHVLYGQGEKVSGPFAKSTQWYDTSIEPLKYDPDEALRIFEELGWARDAEGWLSKDGKRLEFNLITNNGNQQRKAILTIAQNGWKQIGVKVNTQLFEWAVFLEDFVNPGEFDALVLGWSMGPDPDLYQIWHSSQAGPQQLNFAGYANPRADEIMEKIRLEYDLDAQRTLANDLHATIADDQPYTFLYAPLSTTVIDQSIALRQPDGSLTPLEITPNPNLFHQFSRWTRHALEP